MQVEHNECGERHGRDGSGDRGGWGASAPNDAASVGGSVDRGARMTRLAHFRLTRAGYRVAVPLIVLAAALAITACGSSSKSTTSGGTGGSSPSASTGASATATHLSGTPVKVMAIFDESPAAGVTFPDGSAGISAAVYHINQQSDGIGAAHRPISVYTCVTGGTPQGSAACARKAISGSYVSVVGSYAGTQPVYVPLLQSAGIPDLDGLISASPVTGTSPVAFSTGVDPDQTSALAYTVKHVLHVNNVAIAVNDTAGAGPAAAQLQAVLKGTGIKSEIVVTPVAQADLSAEATQLADDGGAILVVEDAKTAQRMMEAVSQVHSGQLFIQNASTLTQSGIDSLGPAVGNSYLITSFAPTSSTTPGVKGYVSALDATGGAKLADNATESTYTQFLAFQAATAHLATVSRATVLASLKKLTFQSQGLTAAPVDFAKHGPLPGYPNAVNPNFFVEHLVNGVYQTVATYKAWK